MKAMTAFAGRLLGGNVSADGSTWYANRLQWSVQEDLTTWADTTDGTLDLRNWADPIVRLMKLRSDLVVVYRRHSTWLAVETGDPTDAIASWHTRYEGLWAANSLQAIGMKHIFLGYDDVYTFDGVQMDPVGARIRKDLFLLSDEDSLQNAWSFADARAKNYYLVTTLAAGGQRAWIYDWEEGKWSTQNFTDYTSLGTWYN